MAIIRLAILILAMLHAYWIGIQNIADVHVEYYWQLADHFYNMHEGDICFADLDCSSANQRF